MVKSFKSLSTRAWVRMSDVCVCECVAMNFVWLGSYNDFVDRISLIGVVRSQWAMKHKTFTTPHIKTLFVFLITTLCCHGAFSWQTKQIEYLGAESNKAASSTKYSQKGVLVDSLQFPYTPLYSRIFLVSFSPNLWCSMEEARSSTKDSKTILVASPKHSSHIPYYLNDF